MEQNWLTIEEQDGNQILTKCSPEAEGEIMIPQGVTKIAERAFNDCENIKSLIIPNSMISINPSYGTRKKEKGRIKRLVLSVLDFQGTIPETNDTFARSKISVLRINQPRKNCKIPSDILSALDMDNPRHNWSIVYAAPEYCEEVSSIPGYIRVTKALDNTVEYAEHDGDVIDINTKYIVSVEPADIKRYKPVKGSIIRYAQNAYERGVEYCVYEPYDMVLEKIETSLHMLSEQVGGAAGLLNQLETLLKRVPDKTCMDNNK